MYNHSFNSLATILIGSMLSLESCIAIFADSVSLYDLCNSKNKLYNFICPSKKPTRELCYISEHYATCCLMVQVNLQI